MKDGFKYDPVLPLDMLILDFLPPEGANFAGLYPIGEPAKAIVNKALKGQAGLTSVVSSRLRLLHAAGLAIPVKSVGAKSAGKAWQITPKGQKQVVEWKGEGDDDRGS